MSEQTTLPLPRTPQEAQRLLLDQHEAATRSNWRNDGRGFETELEHTLGGYQSRRLATIRKVSPPVRLVGTGERRKVIFLENPFLDFIGSWTAHHGRAIFIEAKSTATHRLPFRRAGGLTETQWAALKSWRLSGAAAALVWQWAGRVALFTPEMMLAAEAVNAAALVHESGLKVLRGEGNVLWDFLGTLEGTLWPKEAAPAV